MFLAIAVDNLANAQELTAAEEEAEEEDEKVPNTVSCCLSVCHSGCWSVCLFVRPSSFHVLLMESYFGRLILTLVDYYHSGSNFEPGNFAELYTEGRV